DTAVMGTRFSLMSDPIELTLMSGGTVLFYVSKANIARDRVFVDYKKYIDLCGDIDKELIKEYQDRLKEYTGARDDRNKFFYSASLDLLKKGIVVHHGSMPLKMRSIIEDFINAGLCRICFATSTIEQGINMPFDTVYITRFEKSKPLAIKNLIGRAGRSTAAKKLDVGRVIINSNNVTDFRKIVNEDYKVRTTSLIEEPVKELGSDFDDFRESIINGTFVEEFNMPQKQVDILSAEELQGKISEILPTLINNDNSLNEIYKLSKDKSDSIYQLLIDIYERHLNRNVVDAERAILIHALHILFYRMYYKTFSAICKVRYKRLCNFEQIKKLHSLGRDYSRVKVQYLPAYSDIPNSNLQRFPLVELSRFAKDVDFDVVVYDTYDYLDKLIGFKLSDIYYAAFKVNYEKTDDERALVFANLIKYGTSDEKEIYMIRYGLTLDDINTLEPFIDNIDATGITVLPEFYNLSEDVKKPLERFV
ncbi:MAG: helicase, partial [Bacteroidales bacterium]|nr:helicase [Bacteroidales bacterium]